MMFPHAWVIFILDIVPALFAIVGNSIFFLTLWRTTSLHTPSNTLLGFLSIIDLLVGLICHPLFIATLLQSPGLCCTITMSVYNFLFGLTIWTSFLYILLITVDRFFAVFFPFEYRKLATCKKSCLIATIAFGVSACYSTAVFFLYKESRMTFILVDVIVTSLTFLFIIVAYTMIYRAMSHHRNRIVTVPGGGDAEARKFGRPERFKINTVALVLLAFICCNAPYTAYMLQMFLFFLKKSRFVEGLGMWANFFFLLSSAINPLIYFLMRSDIRLAARRMLFGCTADHKYAATVTRTTRSLTQTSITTAL